jgi:hypothetical protein
MTKLSDLFGIFGSGIPSGGVIGWSGAIADIPSGWHLCEEQTALPILGEGL